MAVNVLGAAAFLVKASDRSLSNLELQKLLYIAHMFYLGRHNAPLVHGHFQAWYYGPVHPDLYREARIYGARPGRMVYRAPERDDQSREAALLQKTYEGLGDATPGTLVSITHRKDGAWDKHYTPGKRGVIIPNEDILQEYRDCGYD